MHRRWHRATLIFLAIRSQPDARTTHLAGEVVTELLQSRPYRSTVSLEIQVNEARFLRDSGPNAEGALHAVHGFCEYYEHRMPSEILVALPGEGFHVDQGTPDSHTRTALDGPDSFLKQGPAPVQQGVIAWPGLPRNPLRRITTAGRRDGAGRS